MTTVILVLQFILAVVLTIAVLLQKSSSIGLGAYSGSNESLFGAKGPAGFMAKFTFIVGFLFVLNTLALGYFYNQDKKASVIEDVEIQKSVPSMPAMPETPVAPQAPAAPATPVASEEETSKAPVENVETTETTQEQITASEEQTDNKAVETNTTK